MYVELCIWRYIFWEHTLRDNVGNIKTQLWISIITSAICVNPKIKNKISHLPLWLDEITSSSLWKMELEIYLVKNSFWNPCIAFSNAHFPWTFEDLFISHRKTCLLYLNWIPLGILWKKRCKHRFIIEIKKDIHPFLQIGIENLSCARHWFRVGRGSNDEIPSPFAFYIVKGEGDRV